MTYFTGSASVTNGTPTIVVASDAVDRSVLIVCGSSLISLGFTSATCDLFPPNQWAQFVLPAGVDLYAATSYAGQSVQVLVTKMGEGPSSFSGTISGTFS